MFIKITRSGKYKYAQAVKSYRENGKIKHKVCFNLGRLDEIEGSSSIASFAKKLLALAKIESPAFLGDISCAEIVNWGYIVYRKIWNSFGLDKILANILSGTKAKFSLSDTSFLMVLSNLLSPKSKLATYRDQESYLNLSKVGLNDIYRSLDILSESKEEIEEEMFYRGRNLFNMNVDIVFYDVTTFYFESVKADSLRDFGFSKDLKVGQVQVVMAMIIDSFGRPIGYDLFSGSTFEGKTLDVALDKLKRRFSVGKVIIVADKGINSKLNLKRIVDRGYDYIVSMRLKSAGSSVRDKMALVKKPQEDTACKAFDYVNEFKVGAKKYKLHEKLIITYSEKRAKKDAIDRERLIRKAMKLLRDKSRIKAVNRRGGKKYIREVSKKTEYALDTDAISKDRAFDGYYAIQTSQKGMDDKDVISAYHNLWRIEESFKIMKSTLEVRPIFHWTEKRIKGHFVICFLAFLLARHVEFRLKQQSSLSSPEKIREAINSCNFAKVRLEGKTYFIKTKQKELASKLLRVFRIASPKNLTPADELNL